MNSDEHPKFSGRRLVVFGCGYVGGAFARQALERGLQVTALTRNPDQAAALRAAGIATVEADLAGEAWHAAIPAGADFVLNCVSSGGGGAEGYRRSYAEGMRSVLAWADKVPVGTLVYTGSTSVYPQDGGVTVDENAPTEPAGERARILLDAEKLLRDRGNAGFRWFILRLAGIYGPGRHYILDHLRAGTALPGRPGHRLNLAHREDICRAVWSCFCARPGIAGEIFNVADDAPPLRGELVDWLAGKLGQPNPGFTEGGTRAELPDRVISNAKIKRLLGWFPQYPSYREGYTAILGNDPAPRAQGSPFRPGPAAG